MPPQMMYIKMCGFDRVKRQPSVTQKTAAEVPDESIKTEKKNKNGRKRQEVDLKKKQ